MKKRTQVGLIPKIAERVSEIYDDRNPFFQQESQHTIDLIPEGIATARWSGLKGRSVKNHGPERWWFPPEEQKQ